MRRCTLQRRGPGVGSEEANRVRGQKPGSQQGFTLVELLVVIAIIGILMACCCRRSRSCPRGGRRAQCTNNLKQIGFALLSNHDSYKKFPRGTCCKSKQEKR